MPAVVAGDKPPGALGAGAMGKTVRFGPLPCVALQCVIANLACRVHRFLKIAGLNAAKPIPGMARGRGTASRL